MYFFKVSHGDGSQIAAPPFAQQRGVEPDSDVEEPGIGLEPWDPRGGTDAVEGVQYVVARLKHRQCRLGRELERLLHGEGAERLGQDLDAPRSVESRVPEQGHQAMQVELPAPESSRRSAVSSNSVPTTSVAA